MENENNGRCNRPIINACKINSAIFDILHGEFYGQIPGNDLSGYLVELIVPPGNRDFNSYGMTLYSAQMYGRHYRLTAKSLEVSRPGDKIR